MFLSFEHLEFRVDLCTLYMYGSPESDTKAVSNPGASAWISQKKMVTLDGIHPESTQKKQRNKYCQAAFPCFFFEKKNFQQLPFSFGGFFRFTLTTFRSGLCCGNPWIVPSLQCWPQLLRPSLVSRESPESFSQIPMGKFSGFSGKKRHFEMVLTLETLETSENLGTPTGTYLDHAIIASVENNEKRGKICLTWIMELRPRE